MIKFVPSLILIAIISLSVTAQIQKTPNNRVYLDEDYEYTELARRNRNVKEQLDRGMRFYKARDYKAAADAFASAMKWDPAVFDAHFNSGVTRLYLADYRGAVNDLQNALKLAPSSAIAWHFLGFAYFNLNNDAEAITSYRHSLDIDGSSGVTWNNLGSLTIEPESATARYNLAMTCLAMNQKDCAREQYAILKHVEPDLSSQLLDQIYGSKLLRLMK